MSEHDPGAKDPPGGAPRRSGRVQFDDRGQAIWEWELQTGMFDRNASTQRVRVLTQNAFDLRIDEPAPASPAESTTGGTPRAAPGNAPPPGRTPPKPTIQRASGNPYDNAGPARQAGGGGDPYSREPSRAPDTIDFDPSVYSPKR